MEILVYLEIKNGKIAENSLDLVSFAKEISKGCRVICTTVSSKLPDLSELYESGANKLYFIKSDSMPYDKRKHPYYLTELIKKINPDIFILNSTTEGREIAPIVASSLNLGLTADCTGLEIEDNKLISTRPTFGGKLMASILSRTTPNMATVRVNTFRKKNCNFEGNLEIEELTFNVKNPKSEILSYTDTKEDFTTVQNSKIILSGGMGLKTKENFDKLKLLASKIGAIACGTRKAVDKGFIEKELQVGQTGKTVTPDIYVAFGISGAIHHIVGMENSKKIIAINTDKNAPVFKHADIGIIEDAGVVLDKLIEIF